MSDESRAPAQASHRVLLLVLSLVGLIVLAWSCILAWVLVRLAVDAAHWLF